MPLRDGFFSTATQTSCCNRIQRSNRVRLLVVSTHDFPDTDLHGGLHGPPRSLHGPPWSPPRTSMEASTDLHGASTDLHGDLHGPPWRPPRTSMETSADLHGAPRTSMETSTDLLGDPRTSMETSTELHGHLHGAPWRPLRTSMSLRGDLHEPPWRPPRTDMETSTDLDGDLHGPTWRPPQRCPWRLHGGLFYANNSKKNLLFVNNFFFLIYQYSFKLKFLYFLFFKGFHGFYFIFAYSNFIILFKICPERCHLILAPTHVFGYELKAHLSQSSARVTCKNSRLEKCMHAFKSMQTFRVL